MKRINYILNIIEELTDKDRQLDLAREDNASLLREAVGMKVRILQMYENELLEQQKVVNQRLEQHRKYLRYYECSELVGLYFEGQIHFEKKVIDFTRLSIWINFLNEEV